MTIEIDDIENRHIQLIDAVEMLDEGFILFDKNQKVVTANKQVHNFYDGIDIDLSPGADRKDVLASMSRKLSGEPTHSQIEKYLSILESGLDQSNPGVCLNLSNGRKISVSQHRTHDMGTVALIRDITAQDDKQTELEEQMRLLTSIFENISIGISVFDSSHRVLSWNNKYLDIMDVDPTSIFVGVHMQQLLEHNFSSYIEVGDSPEEFGKMIIKSFQDNGKVKVIRRTKTGKFVEVFRTNLPNGGFIFTFTDITVTKSAQLMLQESEDRYHKMVELSPDAIFVQKDGFIIYANLAAVKLLGANNLHNLVGTSSIKFFPTADHMDLKAHLGSSDHMEVGENVPSKVTQTIGLDGRRINVEVEATALLYGDRPVMQLIARDISAQTKVQELLKEAKEAAEYAAQLKGTFLANMSHELRTPLNAVIGFSEIIKNEIFGKVGSKKYLEYAEDIHTSGVHLLDLINSILDLSKIESGTQKIIEESVDVGSLIDNCLSITSPQKESARVEITASISSNTPNILADSRMLKQVLINLISNAIKFTPKGGVISLNSGLSPDGSFYLVVQDTGIGIKEEDIAKALTPFVQIDSEMSRKYHGTGLGLSLSKNLMELHGGGLTLESTYGEGTTVTISFPGDRVIKSAA
ncbi:MAG: PAS-domain containing protein [Sneathiella sp.]